MTPLGHGAWATFRALLDGRTLATRADRLYDDTKPFDLVRGLGGVALARHSAADPAVELAERAAREAITEAGVEALGMPTWLGCSKGAVVALERAADRSGCHGLQSVPCHEPSGSRARTEVRGTPQSDDVLAPALGPHGFLEHHLRRRLGVEPWSHCVAACASSLVALDRARRALRAGRCREALVVSAEAALTPMFVGSYRRLGVLAPQTTTEYVARPLDARRSGFMLAEVGVAVVLHAVDPGQAWPGEDDGRPAPELLDTATACEAFDMIRSPPPRKMDALRHVATTLFAGRPISALHPHAPGTADHDPAELSVLADALNAGRATTQTHRPVSVYASKGALGHTLGAAGLVSFVLACLMRRTAKRPPMPWLDEPMSPTPMPLVRDAQGIDPGGCHAMFAAGFGGHTAGAVVR